MINYPSWVNIMSINRRHHLATNAFASVLVVGLLARAGRCGQHADGGEVARRRLLHTPQNVVFKVICLPESQLS